MGMSEASHHAPEAGVCARKNPGVIGFSRIAHCGVRSFLTTARFLLSAIEQ